MAEDFSIYSVTAGAIMLVAVLSGNMVYKQHLLVAFQVLISAFWAAMASIHCWGAAIIICRKNMGMTEASLPLLSVYVFAVLFILTYIPGLLLSRWFSRRLPQRIDTNTRSRAICALATAVLLALIMLMNAALLLPTELSTPLPEQANYAGRLPVRMYLRWSGNWARPADPPAGFADFLDRWLAR